MQYIQNNEVELTFETNPTFVFLPFLSSILPKVTILLPVYNAADSLPIAIESILVQTLQDFEFLLINDGSTDESPQIMAHYAAKDPRIRILTQPQRGIAIALNRGLEEAQSPYIARMDADDFSFPTRLEKQYHMLEHNPSLGLVGCLVAYGGESHTQTGYATYVDWVNQVITPEDISLNRFIESPLPHPSVMFRTTCVKTWGGYTTDPLPEDYELWLRWLGAGVKMAKVHEKLIQWNDPPDRLSRQHPHYSDDAFASVRAQHLYQWLKAHNPHHPKVMIWGAGRKSRKRSARLLAHGCEVIAYIDLKDASPIHGVSVHAYAKLAEMPACFLLTFVNNRGAREKIRSYLGQINWIAGKDFLIC